MPLPIAAFFPTFTWSLAYRVPYLNGELDGFDTISNHQVAPSNFVIGRTCPDGFCARSVPLKFLVRKIERLIPDQES